MEIITEDKEEAERASRLMKGISDYELRRMGLSPEDERRGDVALDYIDEYGKVVQQRDLEEFAKVYIRELEGASPQELEEVAVEVVRPEATARWRAWGVPEEIIERCIL